jgi:DNA-binding transcriptional LysR family regulator
MALDGKLARRLKLKDLQTLLAVAEVGGMGKAADRLNYSQPTVSKAIANLERTLGRRLLDRGRNGVELTPYGLALLRCGTAVFDELRRGMADIEFLSDPTAGEVRVGCSEPVSAGIMAAVIDRIAKKYPRVTFQVEVTNPSTVCSDVSERRLDFAITQNFGTQNFGQVVGERLQIETLYDDPVVVVGSVRHKSANKRRLKLRDLADERWALPPPNSFISPLLADAFRAAGLNPPNRAVTAPSAYLRILLAAGGNFLTVVPSIMLDVGLRQLPIKALPIELHRNRRPVAIVTLKDRALSPVAQLFIEHTRAVAKAISRD